MVGLVKTEIENCDGMNAETASLRGGMDLRHLRYFQAVAEELSFSGAARRLRIAQPALSRAVQELEEACGVRLLDRNRRVVKLTPAGAVMLREAGLLFERWEESLRRVQRTAAGEEGELRLGYIGPPTRGFLASVVKEYRRRWPRVTHQRIMQELGKKWRAKSII
jgi:DNA-binding transcriptional LysR family regulator